MKCIKNDATHKIKRVTNELAIDLVSSGDWNYVPKAIWKRDVRDVSKNTKPNKEANNAQN